MTLPAWKTPLLAVLALAACAKSEVPKAEVAAPAGPNVVQVVATDYQFQAPDTLPAGPTLFQLTDNGKEPHHIQLIRLEQGKTLQDMISTPPAAGPQPWAVEVGGPNAPRPGGGVSEAAVTLTPGNYAMVCMIPSPAPDGKIHMAKGMMKAITVVESAEARAMPEADLTLTLSDYAFTFSGPVTAGKHVIRVTNPGPQVHEVLFVRLAPGKTAKDMADWIMGGMASPPPGEPFGGTTGMAAGGENLVIADFTAGEYAMLCFMPDAKDGRPHVMLGMVSQFTVK